MFNMLNNLSFAQSASLACLILFSVIGAFDGIYFHLIKYKLHENPDSRLEHIIHAIRSFLFSPIALLFFVIDSRGGLLWLAIGLVMVDLVLETIDVLVEKESRRKIGGISSAESAVHVLATGFKTASLAFVMGAKPMLAWSLTSVMAAKWSQQPTILVLVGSVFAISTFIGGVSHLVMLRLPGEGREYYRQSDLKLSS